MAISGTVIKPNEQAAAELSGLFAQLDSVRDRLSLPGLSRIEKSAMRLHERVLRERIDVTITQTRKPNSPQAR